MPTPLTIRPADKRAVAYAEFVEIVGEALRNAGVRPENIWTNQGAANQSGDLPLVSNGAVRFTPSSQEWEVVSIGKHRGERGVSCPVDVAIETRVQGDNWANSISLWGIIERALGADQPADRHQAIRKRLKSAGISQWEVTKPAEIAGENAVASGVIRLHVGKYV